MKIKKETVLSLLTFIIFSSAIIYAFYYFNYFETPTGDFIGNIRPRVLEYINGQFPGSNFKFLPFYPLILAALTIINPFESHDTIYHTAIILNFVLYPAYLILTYKIYKIFLKQWAALGALLYLTINIYTVYTAVNSELEMILSLTILISIYATMHDKKLGYFSSFLAAITKWDAVFTIPAVMFRDFFIQKKRWVTIFLGGLATSGVALWLLVSVLNSTGSHVYVQEIAQRGPNIYKYLIDCLLVVSSFLAWMGIDGYFSNNIILTISLFSIAAFTGLFFLINIIWGIKKIISTRFKEFAPIFIFFIGFILIHLIYQNTKSRYVLPILWLLILFLFYGLTEGFYPWLLTKIEKPGNKLLKIVSIIISVLFILSFLLGVYFLVDVGSPIHILYSIMFISISSIIIFKSELSINRYFKMIMIIGISAFINFSIFYGIKTMDHYSLRRVEFKEAALWYKENANENSRMLITESGFMMYYSGFDYSKYYLSLLIKSDNINDLVYELKEKKITHVFVDDFYIRRLIVNDKNAIDRKAPLFKEIKDKASHNQHFELIKQFKTKGNITSDIYKFIDN